ncbi:hypothetical protein [Polaromonas sp. YR568]|uniref:hypothetical protein n=1 Tax=Polaromonas sp. YR568 TaxID=1855301 RepID=UPI0031381AA7
MSDDITLGEAVQREYEAWEKEQLLDIRKQLEEAKVRSQIASLNSETELTPGLAAIFTGRSERNLRELRGTKSGPVYTQPETDSTARNQKITYRLGDLKDWLASQRTTSTIHAAERRGTMFATLQSLGVPEPFWVHKQKGVEAILGHVLATPLTSNLISGHAAHIEWIEWPHALRMPWSNGQQRQVFEVPYTTLLTRALDAANAGREATELI